MRALVPFGIALILAATNVGHAWADAGSSPDGDVPGAEPPKGLLDPDTGEELSKHTGWLPSGWLGWLACLVLGVLVCLRTRAALRTYRNHIRQTVRRGVGEGDRRTNAKLFTRVLWRFGSGTAIVLLVALFTLWWVTLVPGADDFWSSRFATLLFLLLWVCIAHKDLFSDATSWRRGAFWCWWVFALGIGTVPLAMELDANMLGGDHRSRTIAKEAERIGEALLRDGQYDAAMRHYDRAFEHATRPDAIHSKRAGVWQDLGEYERTIADRQAAIRLAPGAKSYLGDLAESYRHFGRRAEATAAFLDHARQLKANGEFQLFRLLMVWDRWYRVGDFAIAVEVYDTLIRTRTPGVPTPECFSDRAVALHAIGRYSSAKDDHQSAVAESRAIRNSSDRGWFQASEYSYLVWLLATCPDEGVYSPAAALGIVAEAEQLLDVIRPADQADAGKRDTAFGSDIGQWHYLRFRLGVATSAAKLASGDVPGARDRLEKARISLGESDARKGRGLDFEFFWKQRMTDLAAAIDAGKPYREREPAPEPRPAK